MKKIAIMTAGGDCTGLNAAIKSVVLSAYEKEIEVIGILDGYKGFVEGMYTRLTPEDVADIEVKSSNLHSTNIDGSLIPSLVDEIPIIALCATQAEGVTTISGAGELRLKESDRLKLIATQLNKMGANITETQDGLVINGKTELKGCSVATAKDHRIAMMLSIAALCADGQTTVEDSDCVNISFSNFYDVLKQICK